MLACHNASCRIMGPTLILKNSTIYIRHVKMPPGHHQSTGLVERYLQELKLYLHHNNTNDCQLAIATFCLHHNSMPLANGAIPSQFVFLQPLRTRVSVPFTEKDPPHLPVSIYVWTKNRQPAPTTLISKVGTTCNTSLDQRKQLLHVSFCAPRPSTLPDTKTEPQDANLIIGQEVASSPVDSGTCISRHSGRSRHPPSHYGIDE